MLDTRFAMTEGVGDGINGACFLVSLLDSKPLSPEKS